MGDDTCCITGDRPGDGAYGTAAAATGNMAGGWAMGMAPSYSGIDVGIGALLGNMLLSAMSCRNGRPVYDHHTETLDASPSFLVFEARNSSMIRIDVDPGRFLSSRVPKNGSSGTDGFGFVGGPAFARGVKDAA